MDKACHGTSRSDKSATMLSEHVSEHPSLEQFNGLWITLRSQVLIRGDRRQEISANRGCTSVRSSVFRRRRNPPHPERAGVWHFDAIPEPVTFRAGFASLVAPGRDRKQSIAVALAQAELADYFRVFMFGRFRPERRRFTRSGCDNYFRVAGRPRSAEHAASNLVCRIPPAHVCRMLGRVDRPVSGTRCAIESASIRISRCIAVDLGRRQKRSDLEVEMAWGALVGPFEHGAEQLSTFDETALDGERVIKMPVHREKLNVVLHDDDKTWIFRAGENELAVSNGKDSGAGRVALDRVVILAGVQPSRVVPRIFTGISVSNDEPGAENLARQSDRKRKDRPVRLRGGCNPSRNEGTGGE